MAAKQPGGRRDPLNHHRRPESPASEALIAAARAMYETMPGATFELLAKELGTNAPRIRKWKQKDADRGIEWKRNAFKAIPELASKAHELADTFKASMAARGKPMTDEVAKNEAQQELTEQHAVNQRAMLIDRHRQEWAAPRKLAYEAVNTGNFDRAKLAKITAETLTLIQGGECRAWGIDPATRGQGGGTVLTIDRGLPGAPAETIEDEAGAAAADVQMPAAVIAAGAPAEAVTGDTSTTDDVF